MLPTIYAYRSIKERIANICYMNGEIPSANDLRLMLDWGYEFAVKFEDSQTIAAIIEGAAIFVGGHIANHYSALPCARHSDSNPTNRVLADFTTLESELSKVATWIDN